MHARIVRFTGVDRANIDRVIAVVNESDGPPPGVNATGMKLFYDEAQRTALFVGRFATAEDMAAADSVFESMDAGATPGTRASVDRCELVLERDG